MESPFDNFVPVSEMESTNRFICYVSKQVVLCIFLLMVNIFISILNFVLLVK